MRLVLHRRGQRSTGRDRADFWQVHHLQTASLVEFRRFRRGVEAELPQEHNEGLPRELLHFKGQARKQIICLACVAKLMGQLKFAVDAWSLTLCERGHDQQDTMLFERLPSRSWKQQLKLTDELLEGAVAANESSISRKKPRKAAADT
jgi:hypothetical protein